MKDSVVVYWIEQDSGQLRSQSMGSADIPGGRTYVSEVLLKYGRDPIDITVIHTSRAGNDWEKDAVERLRTKAAELREKLGL